jgi:Tfp pilus assembly PilM family ATPase
MSPLFSQIDHLRKRYFNRSYGWTGIEIGCHEIKLAQVRKLDSHWQLEAIWAIEHPTPFVMVSQEQPTNGALPIDELFGWIPKSELEKNGLANTIEHLENLSTLFHGGYCAATLTDGLIEYRELDLPANDLSEAKEMVRSEIALEKEFELEELLADGWELPQSKSRSKSSCYAAVSLERETALRFASDLLEVGFECQALDAVPCAMARATSMVDGDNDDSTLAIDLGYHQATMTLVKQGRPLLSRGIRSLGLIALLEKIAESFGVNVSDSQTLLFQSPNSRHKNTNDLGDFSNPLQQKLGCHLQTLTNEIARTIQYASQVYRSSTPCQILLMGPGTRIPSIEIAIANRVDLSTNCWSIDVSDNLFGNQSLASYAIAAGLSALAWEKI